MRNSSFISKEAVVEAVVESISKNAEDAEIRTFFMSGFLPPERILSEEGEARAFTPDVVHRTDEGIELYAVELDKSVELNKWSLFAKYAKKKNGTFCIVTYEDNLNHFKSLLESNDIAAKLIYF